MIKYMTGAAVALGLMNGAALAADAVTLQLKWVTQAQFAGYYVALDKGYYADEDLEVTILPGGPDIAPVQVLMGGGADVMVDWMPSALAAREQGAPVVNIAQPFKSSGMMLTCLKESGVASPEDFPGKTLGVWFFGNEYPFLSWMSTLGIPTEDDYVRAYCARTGLDGLPKPEFYFAFNLFRFAGIVQGVYHRSLQGNASNAKARSSTASWSPLRRFPAPSTCRKIL